MLLPKLARKPQSTGNLRYILNILQGSSISDEELAAATATYTGSTAPLLRRGDDIERVGKGVYSPQLRDNAQDARDSIFAFLSNMSGKEAFLALMELSLLHPNDADRP